MTNYSEGQTETTERRIRRSRRSFLIRLVVGIVFVVILVWQTDPVKLIDALKQINPWWFLLALVVQVVGKFVWAFRWSTVFNIFEIPHTFWRLVKGIYVGIFFSNFLPTSFGGDFYRGHWILDDKKLYAKSMFTIFVERFIGFATLGYIALPAFLILFWRDLEPPLVRLVLLFALLALCSSILLLHPSVVSFLNRVVFRNSDRFFALKRRSVEDSVQILHNAGRQKWLVYLLSVGVHVVGITFFYCLGRGLGLPLEGWHYLVIVPIIVVISSLPISLNALGVREVMIVLLTAALGTQVTPSQGIALGLTSTIAILLVSLVGGLVYMMGSKQPELAIRKS